LIPAGSWLAARETHGQKPAAAEASAARKARRTPAHGLLPENIFIDQGSV
jgi:hypothetical protein